MTTQSQDEAAAKAGSAPRGTAAAPMQGGGFYNQHARLQAVGSAIGLELLAEAVQRVPVGPAPLVVADYGCSQGKNSLRPMRLAIDGLRARAGASTSISVVHTDQPENDFAALFRELEHNLESYVQAGDGIYPSAIGRSFYRQLFADGSVTLGWSAFAAHWLSTVPSVVAGHIAPVYVQEPTRRIFADQSASDWRLFLRLRARELRPGGRLIVLQPGVIEAFQGSEANFFTLVQNALIAMEADGFLRGQERARMVVPVAGRRPSEVAAPFAAGPFEGLSVEASASGQLPDPFWEQYQTGGDVEALWRGYARFFQSTMLPSLLTGLDPDRDVAFRAALVARIEQSFRQHITADPQRLTAPNLLHALLLAKR